MKTLEQWQIAPRCNPDRPMLTMKFQRCADFCPPPPSRAQTGHDWRRHADLKLL